MRPYSPKMASAPAIGSPLNASAKLAPGRPHAHGHGLGRARRNEDGHALLPPAQRLRPASHGAVPHGLRPPTCAAHGDRTSPHYIAPLWNIWGDLRFERKAHLASRCKTATYKPRLFNNGEGGIRTPGAISRTLVFETSSISHSDTSPHGGWADSSHQVYGMAGLGSTDTQVDNSRCSRHFSHEPRRQLLLDSRGFHPRRSR